MTMTTGRVAPDRVDATLGELRSVLRPDQISTAGAVRDQHGIDEGLFAGVAPDAVVFARSTEDVVAAVRACAAHGTPLVPFGAGTSLEGHIAALAGGISLDLGGMDRVLEVNVDDLDCRVQAGVHRVALNDTLRRDGLFFPIDPGADATIGGMASTRASGTNAVRYGTMRDNVLGLTVVLADGRVVRTGTRARKSAAGYDLTRLFVGAEGTLGVITEVALRLHGLPEAMSAAVCGFPTVADAVRTTIETVQLGIPVARIELLDAVQVAACNAYSDLGLAERPMLFLEFHGNPAAVADQAQQVGALARANGGDDWSWTGDEAERNRLWKARHDAYYAALALRPGCRGMPTDVCVPISRLAGCIEETRRDLDDAGVVAPIVGHVGDGNFHVIFLVHPDRPAELDQVKALNDRLVQRALSMGGTCTGEHGIGYGKMAHLRAEHGEAVDVMATLKAALDPAGLFNPGKITG